MASATTKVTRAEKLQNKPSGMHRATNTNTTQAVLQSGKAEVTQDDQGLLECAGTVPGTPSSGHPSVDVSITADSSCGQLLRQHTQGGGK